MTRACLERVVGVWQGRLGLAHWEYVVVWDEPCGVDADAVTVLQHMYDRAELRLCEGWDGWDVVFANRIVVHELLHLLVRDVDRVVASVEGELSASAWRLLDDRYDHEVEGLVDRLAVRLVELGGVVDGEDVVVVPRPGLASTVEW